MPAHKKSLNTARTTNVSVRLDPKLHYLATLAAREQGRTVSSFIEWAVRRTLSDAVAMRDAGEPMPGMWPSQPAPLWMESLWDIDEADRFYNLATLRASLLTIAEQRLWKLFTMHMAHTGQKISIKAFRDFWNDPSINTSHLSEGEGE
jgi:hypothetical protein